jgi:hypothetical protein
MKQCAPTNRLNQLFLLRVAVLTLVLPVGARLVNAPPAAAQATPKAVSAGTGETSPLPPGWTEVDQRMVFLTVQLSTVESTIAATNKSLKIHGYEQAHRQNDADNAAKANERMDRNGGAPVSWQDFYGQTAEKFFYHPTDNNTIHINPDAVAQRPPQFDYIYRANDQRMDNAQADVQKIGGKIEDLLGYRRQLESEQSALWAKIAFRGDSSLNIGARPLYRLDHAPASDDATGRQYAAAANAAVAFMNAIDRELADAQKTLSTDQTQAFDRLLATTTAAHVNASRAFLGQPALSAYLDDPRTPLGRFSRAAKRLEDSAQNISDAIRLAADCDGKDDQSGKQVYRGQLQRMIFDYSSSFATADQAVTDMVAGWKLKEVGTLRPAPSTPAAAGDGDAMTQLESAKYARERAVAAAHRSIGAAIDSRLDAAADAGDLAMVQSLAAAKVTVARDGSLPDDVKDPAVLDAARQAQQQISTANGTLGAAYRTAVATLTRQRKFSDAQIVQDELSAFLRNSSAPPAGDAAVAGASPAAGGSLPPVSPAAAQSKISQFGRAPAAGWQYDNQFEVRSDGILLPEQHYVRSTATDFLEKDFRLDVWITIDPKYPSTYIGLGSAQNGPHATPVNSIYMVINSDGRISMATREGYGDQGMGKEEDAGKYVMRLEKIGLTVTYSIGTLDKAGNFQTDVTQTFSDISKTPADFNNRNMHIFFGGGMLHQMRFTLLPPGSQPQSSIDSPQLSKVASLSAILPKYFECATWYSITAGGMELPVGHFIRTRASDYLDRDFTFDVWLSINEKDKSGGMIGLGTGLDDQGGTPENSVFLKINHRSPDLNIRRSGTRADLNRRNLESGEYMARIEKKGLTVTFSLGVEESGVFKSEYTRTVPDINNTSDAHFTNRNMHLFFGAGCFTRFRFVPARQVERKPDASRV